MSFANGGVILKEPVNLNRTIEEEIMLLGVSVPPEVGFTFHYAEPAPHVLVNPLQLRQIIMNLITNAIQAIGGREGMITIETKTMKSLPTAPQPQDTDPREYAVFSIHDTGDGIAAEVREELFEPFVTSKPTGRGLGLAIVREHVNGNDGDIEVESGQGTGTTFTTYLPACEAPAPDPTNGKVPAPIPDTICATILVIDDESDVLETTWAMLSEVGCRVLTASNGPEGLMCFHLNESEIDLVIVDMTMPSMDGIAVRDDIRSVRPDVPVILASGYDERSLRDISIDLENCRFLQKPYQLEDLVRLIMAMLKI